MPQDTARGREHYLRVRWLISLLYLCGLRISEVVNNTMDSFFSRRDRHAAERRWLEITGKGGKTRIVPATDELMVKLAPYRRELKMPPLPVPGETAPLLFPIGGRHAAMTRRAIHAIVKHVVENAAQRLRQRGAEFSATAVRLGPASAHWLRHTAGSHMANSDVDLRHVRDNLGNESISTTSGYAHSSDH
jgi:integrase/recombinase XerD